MGYISIQSRRDAKTLIYSSVLYDSADQDDELTGFYPGDTMIISLDIDDEAAKLIRDKNLEGGIVGENILRLKSDGARSKVDIEFRILKRSHLVMRDWMTNQHGFRSSGTLIYLEAVSDKAEELFLELQKTFDTRNAY